MDLITLKNWTSEEINATVELGLDVKAHPERYSETLARQSLVMLFQKTSTRTRTAFEVGMTQLGGNAIYLDFRSTNFVLADLRDEAQVLSRYADGIVARMMKHEDLKELAFGAEVPIVNACCDRYHPCQALGDLMTIWELRGKLDGAHLVYTGIRNNVCNSLIAACTKTGVRITAVTPEVNEPSDDQKLLDEAMKTNLYRETLDLHEAVATADYVYTDTWIDMEFFLDPSKEEENRRRIQTLTPYQINMDLLQRTEAMVMHCLPAHKGYEVTAEVMASPRSVAVDQAENRLHIQKALLLKLLGEA